MRQAAPALMVVTGGGGGGWQVAGCYLAAADRMTFPLPPRPGSQERVPSRDGPFLICLCWSACHWWWDAPQRLYHSAADSHAFTVQYLDRCPYSILFAFTCTVLYVHARPRLVGFF